MVVLWTDSTAQSVPSLGKVEGAIGQYCCEVEVILMDINMPVMNGIEAKRRLKERSPELP